jgi:cytidine deaminase
MYGAGMDIEELIRVASLARSKACVPLSRFRVGAAVITASGAIFEGCNTECIIPVLGVCAERNAINHAIIHGEQEFLAVAVVSDLSSALLPCGACLQYIQEFAREGGRDILIVSQGASGERIVASVNELFKGGFPADTSYRDVQESFRWTSDS